MATLECGKSTTDLCGGEVSCDCSKLVDPFPCEPGRPEGAAPPDGRYTDREFYKLPREPEQTGHFETYPYVTGPADGSGNLFNQCELRVDAPRYGRCFVAGAFEGPGGISDFVDSIPFKESKRICGRALRCECGP